MPKLDSRLRIWSIAVSTACPETCARHGGYADATTLTTRRERAALPSRGKLTTLLETVAETLFISSLAMATAARPPGGIPVQLR